MSEYKKILAPVLVPLSLLYGLGVGIRNQLFNLNLLKSVEFDFPVISIGNITIGGTGKTPHVEYLIELLHSKFRVGVLSRGYKRRTKGFLLAEKGASAEALGDESYQIFNKYEDVLVAVDESRVHGIRQLKKTEKNPDVILLDDAFQHRYVMPGVSILLIDYYRPIFKDHLLPWGELRERRDAVRRANIVIVTKVPDTIKPIEKRLWKKELDLFPYQYLYFTRFSYGLLTPLIKGVEVSLKDMKKRGTVILLVTGIANPRPLLDYLKKYSKEVFPLRFPDHHDYTSEDCRLIEKRFEKIKSAEKIMITTEKDAGKLRNIMSSQDGLGSRAYYLPVKIKFSEDKESEFNRLILNYVAKNKKINRLHK